MPEAFGAGLIFKTPQPAAYVNLGAQPVLSDVHRQLFSELFADVHRIFVQISYSSVCGWGERCSEGFMEGGEWGRNIENA